MATNIPFYLDIGERRAVWADIATSCAVLFRNREAAIMAIGFACDDDPPHDWPVDSAGYKLVHSQ